jgi:hypothetical protein
MSVTRHRVIGAAFAALMLVGLTQLLPNSVEAGEAPSCAVIDNGVIRLGVNPQGHLNCGVQDVEGGFVYGITYLPGGATNDALSPGCDCEAWGAGDSVTDIHGEASQSNNPIAGMEVEAFTATADSAVSVVNIPTIADPTLRVTHDYHPSVDTALYEVDVTIENASDAPVTPIYRRAMDWDIPPTEFDEAVTIQGSEAAANVTFSSDDGFASGDPFEPNSWINFIGDAVDNIDTVSDPGGDGPSSDHGALFDFEFESLDPGDSTTFTIFYGAAGTEARANTALAAVDAEMYSYGQPTTPDGPTTGSPNTFIFAFAGVGGLVQFPSVAFASATYTVAEDGGSATIDVALSGPTGQVVRVDYATSDGSAVAGEDYDAVSGTIAIPAGDLDGSFQVPIIADENTEDDETVQLTLSNPQVATEGTPFTAVLTITDTVPVAPPAPPTPADPSDLTG